MTSGGYRGYKPAAAVLSGGQVLIVGGGIPFTVITTAQLYDLKTGTFSLTGSMLTGRSGATATLLLDGRVLIAGGLGAGNVASPQPSCTSHSLDSAARPTRGRHARCATGCGGAAGTAIVTQR